MTAVLKDQQLLIEMHYLPSVAYFVYLRNFSSFVIDAEDIYTKQTYRNRCRINGANKIEDLIIPIKKNKSGKIRTSEVEIDHRQKWLNKHKRAIQSAYGKAPFFEYYADELFEIFNKKTQSLLLFNMELLTKCLEFLEMKLTINVGLIEKSENKTAVYDARNAINPKKQHSSHSLFSPEPYFQVFGNNFAANMSIIDLIFCEGPQAKFVVENSFAGV